MQLWRPDTCECVIEQSVAEGVVLLSKFISRCAFHAALPSDAAAYDAIYGNPISEQKRKNFTHKHMVEDGTYALGEQNASGLWDFKKGIEVNWTWTGTGASRVLQVQVIGATLNQQKKNIAQAWCDAAWGAGKVVIL